MVYIKKCNCMFLDTYIHFSDCSINIMKLFNIRTEEEKKKCEEREAARRAELKRRLEKEKERKKDKNKKIKL